MRKVLAAFLLFLSTLMLSVDPAYADNPSAADIFNTIGGTTTIDRGGSIHSQARSIYSLGGGMVSFQGKKVSLLSADPPSFSAGCNGISWHFGGFAFISLDQIRQLVEAVAQASLGVAVDLAMQTLCPQCYAVMAKLRDISNMMRNAAADACKIAEEGASMLMSAAGITPSTNIPSNCSQTTADSGQTSSFLDSWAGEACSLLNSATDTVTKDANQFMSWLQGGNKAAPNAGTQKFLGTTGNLSYKALTALGYPDGVTKDLMLSLVGMTIIYPVPGADCAQAFQGFQATPPLFSAGTGTSIASSISSLMGGQSSTSGSTFVMPGAQGSDGISAPAGADSGAATAANYQFTTATPAAGGANAGTTVCNAPPLISGFTDIAQVLMCGYYPDSERSQFANTYYSGNVNALNNSSLGAMCPPNSTQTTIDPLVYDCTSSSSAQCNQPAMVNLSTIMPSKTSGNYTGLAWMIGSALFDGAYAVANNQNLAANYPRTVAILNGSGYPLYRLINMAAVYPGLAGELISAYSSAIATQYAMDTLDKIMRIGSQPGINMATNPGINPNNVALVRQQLMELTRMGDESKTQVLERLAEKQKLVEIILQVNKTLQAEVIGQGLSGNNDLAVAVKNQYKNKN